jgi:acyl-CoA synthetase (AMP-forming)/AMP-acid ligase II
MVGYLPAVETAAAFHDGWYRTGDIGHLEPDLEGDAWLHITDRLKEMIKVRGFQVAPAEVEAVLHGDARVRDCAVFGVPDPELGEAIVAAVVAGEGVTVTPAELQDTVAGQLAGYKRVRHMVLVDEIPRLPSGKALRRVLKEQWLHGALARPDESAAE